jgi:hypothetical protein
LRFWRSVLVSGGIPSPQPAVLARPSAKINCRCNLSGAPSLRFCRSRLNFTGSATSQFVAGDR